MPARPSLSRHHDLAERYLHLAAESGIDIANHVIADAGYEAPETYRDASSRPRDARPSGMHRDDLAAYAHGELAQRPAEPVSDAPISARVHVSAVIEVKESDSEEVTRISNTLIAALNAKDPSWGPSRYDLIFHPETRQARFVLFGSPTFLRTMLELLEVLVREPNRDPLGRTKGVDDAA